LQNCPFENFKFFDMKNSLDVKNDISSLMWVIILTAIYSMLKRGTRVKMILDVTFLSEIKVRIVVY